MTARTFIHVETPIPEPVVCPHAEVTVYTRRAPDKETANEDSALAFVGADDTLILAVADGAGGYGDGDAASALAVRSLVDALRGGANDVSTRAAVVNGFENAHRTIKENTTGGATTLVVVEMSGAAIRTYHAGDSGVMVTGGKGLIKLQTLFHSPTGYGVESGLMGEEEALHHEERHIVSNLLGREPMSVEIGSPLTLAPRDTVVVASDGLFDNIYPEEIAEIVRKGPIEDASSALARAAETRMLDAGAHTPSKPDDLTIVLARRKV